MLDYKGESVVLVGVLKGAIVFFTDDFRSIDVGMWIKLRFYFLALAIAVVFQLVQGSSILKDLDRLCRRESMYSL